MDKKTPYGPAFYINIHLPTQHPGTKHFNAICYAHETFESADRGRRSFGGKIASDVLTMKVTPQHYTRREEWDEVPLSLEVV